MSQSDQKLSTTVVYFVVDPKAFILQRLNLALEAKKQGFKVHVATPFIDEWVAKIKDHGFVYHEVHLSRQSENPLSEFRLMLEVLKIFKKIKPDIVHNISLKAVIYGSLMARLARVSKIINLINGLGYLFVDGGGLKKKIIRTCIQLLYKISFASKHV